MLGAPTSQGLLQGLAQRCADGEALEALVMTLKLRQRALASPDTDASALGALRCLRLRCLRALGRYEEALALLSRPEPRPWSCTSAQVAWMQVTGAELAASLERPAVVLEHALEATRARVAVADEEGAVRAARRGLGLLRGLDAPDLADLLLERICELWAEPPRGSLEAATAAAVAARVTPECSDLPRGPERRFELALWQAAARGEATRVRALLCFGVSPAARLAGPVALPTPLIAASAGGHAEVVAQLLAAGAPSQAEDVYGRTALHLAAEAGHASVAACLWQAGADPDRPNALGVTPRQLAEGAGHAEVFERPSAPVGGQQAARVTAF